jgi:acyl-CoA synthetase (AMP-forming)/AMP-acid ligase II
MGDRLLLKELCRYEVGTWADVIYRNALLYGNEEVWIYDDKRITFAQYNERINRLIHALHAFGLKKGDGIGILSWNCLEYTDVYGAAMKGGFIISPFNPRLNASEVEYLVNYSEVKVLFVGPELVEMAAEVRPRLSKVQQYIAVERPAAGMLFHDDLLSSHSSEEPEVS